MMAWVRTATSLITFGFAVYKFFQFELKEAPPVSALIGPRGFGLAMIVIGLLALLLGAAEHWRDLHALRRQYPGMPHSMSAWIGMAIGALGLVALLTVLARA
jgi:putative membrane protein